MNRALKQTSIRLALLLRGASCDEAISTDRAVSGGATRSESAVNLASVRCHRIGWDYGL